MSKAEREAEIEAITATLQASPNVYVTDFAGLDVAKMTEFRRRLRAAGAKYMVVKNTLAVRALDQRGITVLHEHLKGPTGLVLSTEPLAAAKVLSEFSHEHQKPGIRAGLVDGAAVTADHIRRLGSIPDRPTLLAMVAGTWNNILASFAGCLEALREQRGAASNA
ncbi:MAG: 50S ribosomal protein L10 [Gemmatimonadales bacterium]|nr:MAG: 50S ribosomal protein L10 [Gemmatimonadales bacterium]